eukprot:8442415-Karenia_brevis.AAC.1
MQDHAKTLSATTVELIARVSKELSDKIGELETKCKMRSDKQSVVLEACSQTMPDDGIPSDPVGAHSQTLVDDAVPCDLAQHQW